MQQFGVGVEAQGKGADQIAFGLLQFGFGGAFGHKVGQHFLRGGQCRGGVGFLSAEGNAEGAGFGGGREVAVGAVGVAVLIAQGFHQAAVEAAAAENVVAHHQRIIIGVVTADKRHAHHDLRLLGGKRNITPLGVALGHRRHGGAAAAFCRQAGEHGLNQGFGLATVDVAHHRHNGVVFTVAAAVEGAYVGQRYRAQALLARAGAAAVGVVGVIQKRGGAVGHKSGVGFVLLQGGNALVLAAAEHFGIKARLGERLIHQFQRGLQHLGAAQAAQADAGALVAAAAADVGGQIVGARVKRFFIQRARAIGEYGGGEVGHFTFARRVKGRARAFKADLHIDNRVVVACHQ